MCVVDAASKKKTLKYLNDEQIQELALLLLIKKPSFKLDTALSVHSFCGTPAEM